MSDVEETPGRPKPRIESLSDMIFGLALSVGAITLVSNVNNIGSAAALQTDIASFGFSFLILISVWMRYTRIMSVLPLENRRAIFLNTALLFTVSLEPFLFNVMNLDSPLQDPASQYYAIDLGVMMSILGGFTFLLADEERKLVPKSMIRGFKIESASMFLAAAIFFISALEIFWPPSGSKETPLRFYIWIIPFGMSFIRRRTMAVVDGIKKVREK